MRDDQRSSGTPGSPPGSPTPGTRGRPMPPARVRSEELLGGGTELVICHNGRDYRLRVTQNGKLILTA